MVVDYHVCMCACSHSHVFRMEIATSFVNTAQKCGLPTPSKKLFQDLSVVYFLTEMVVVEFSCYP